MTDEQQLKMLHDLKNDFAAMTALINLHKLYKETISPEEVLNRLAERQTVISAAYEKLYQENDYPFINLRNYIEDLIQKETRILSAYSSNIRITTSIAEIRIPKKQAIPFAQLFTELISNSHRHAFENHTGEKLISITITKENGLSLEYSDNGQGLPEELNPKKAATLGMQFICSLSRQLGGLPEFSKTSQGMKFKLKID